MNDFKNEYRNAFESIQPSDDALKSLTEKMSEQANLTALKPKKKHSFFYSNLPLKIATTAACAVLIIGAAIIIPTAISNNNFSDGYTMGILGNTEASKCDSNEDGIRNGEEPENAMDGVFANEAIDSSESELDSTQAAVAGNDADETNTKGSVSTSTSALLQNSVTISSFFNQVSFKEAYETGANEPFKLNQNQNAKIDEFLIDLLEAPLTVYTDGLTYEVLYCFNGMANGEDAVESNFYIAFGYGNAYFYSDTFAENYKLDIDSSLCRLFVGMLLYPDSPTYFGGSNDSYDTINDR